MAKARIRIGTSGWRYDDWRGAFYPDDVKPPSWLAYYGRRFPAVEINNSFYKLPEEKTLRTWRDAAPEGFMFAAKANRFVTHMKKLKDPEEGLQRMMQRFRLLGDRLGPVLYQCPPKWKANAERLEAFLEALPKNVPAAFEFREDSWYGDEVLELLDKHGAALCLSDHPAATVVGTPPGPFVYVRLHGAELYQGSYDGRTLRGWASRIAGWQQEGRDVWCFFDNDIKAAAPGDAARLAEMLGVDLGAETGPGDR